MPDKTDSNLGTWVYSDREGSITLPVPGDRDRLGMGTSNTYARGDTLVVDAALIEATRDREGASNFEDLSPEAQRAAWGRVRFSRPSEDLSIELESERAAEADKRRQERVFEAKRYGRPVAVTDHPDFAKALAAALAARGIEE